MSHSSSRYLKLAILCLLLAVGVHGYLTYHHYESFFGASGPSLCSLNKTFDCDAVNASSYSQFLGKPLALWGMMTNLGLALILAISLLLPDEDKQRWSRIGFWLSLVIASTSIVMGTISGVQLGTYCLFCMAAYGLSFFTLLLVWSAVKSTPFSLLGPDVISTLKSKRGVLIILVAIPFLVWVSDQTMLKSYSASDLPKMIEGVIKGWKAETEYDFSEAKHALTLGADADKARMTLVEFADFRCPHCKVATPKLHNFVRSHPDTRLVFIPFPLDGQCNPAIGHVSGISCRLTKATLCAVEQNQGWEMHDYVFDHQAEFSTMDDANRILREGTSQLKMDWSKLEACMDDAKVHTQVAELSQIGIKVKLEGTPMVFVNGRKLEGFQLIPVLQAAYKEITR